jgi:hypothetical protein
MTLIETDRDPSSRERKALGFALCALGGIIAMMIWHRPGGLMFITWVAGLAWSASMLFNKDEPLSRQWKGVMIPLTAGLAYAAVRYAESAAAIAIAAPIALVTLGISTWVSAEFGNWFYRTWSQLFEPIAWSVSTVLLVLVYLGVLTPIGIILRVGGRDPMHRRFDRDGTSYWIKRDEAVDPERYFRQF